MDEGAVVAWAARHNPDEASALQHAMNLKFQDEAAFFAEYQNEPLDMVNEEDALTADEIAAKTNGMECGAVSIGCTHLTAFIDVQQKLLFWVVTAWDDEFTGFVVDYGAWPDQGKGYYTLRDARRTLERAAPRAGMEGAIYGGLEKLTDAILGKEWQRDDGAMMRVERCLIDANWGQSTDVIYQFCRQSRFAPILLPSHGKYVGASSIPFSEYTRKKGERVGHNWRIPSVKGKRAVRHVIYDTNYWKSFIHARLSVPMGDHGCLSLFGRNPETHRLFSEHLTAEYKVRTEGRGRIVDEWKMKPTMFDNHWFDGIVGCAVAASIQGVSLPGTQEKVVRPNKPIRLSDIRNQRGR
jgi:phage terminase large subunit GpA-like protein